MSAPFTLHLGDCIEVMRGMADSSVDSIVCDPPYGLEFMGKEWDGADGFRRSLNKADVGRDNAFGRASRTSPEYRAGHLFQEWCEVWAAEALRVLKPGGHMLAFSGSRTYHRMATAIEDAGFEIRDQVMWVYGSGFPKSRNIAAQDFDGEDAERWAGWGTALKPAHEPICVARKPLVGTVAANVLQFGTGAINIDACRVDGETRPLIVSDPKDGKFSGEFREGSRHGGDTNVGRWPANLIHDGSAEVVALFPDAKGQQGALTGKEPSSKTANAFGEFAGRAAAEPRGDTGSAARFFYCAKASRKDRGDGNVHPTVKPTDLMAYLVRLVTPPGGLVLDPFMGSGSTGKACMREGFRFVGIDMTPEYVEIARARIEHEHRRVTAARKPTQAKPASKPKQPRPQLDLFSTNTSQGSAYVA